MKIKDCIKSSAYVVAIDAMIRYGRSIGIEVGRAWEILYEVWEDKQTDTWNEPQLEKVRHVVHLYDWVRDEWDADLDRLIEIIWDKVYEG